jgi:hypothetical protein
MEGLLLYLEYLLFKPYIFSFYHSPLWGIPQIYEPRTLNFSVMNFYNIKMS